MQDSVIEIGDRVRIEYPGEKLHEVSLSDATKNGESGAHPTDYAMGEIPEEANRQSSEIERLEEAAAAQAAFRMITGELNGFASQDWQDDSSNLANAQARLFRLRVEPWRRWANGFSCFFFAMVGAPWAIRSRRSDVWSTFFWCCVPILFSYYPLMMYGVAQAKAGVLPAAAVWLGNILLLGLGVVVMSRFSFRIPLLGRIGLGHL